MFRIIQGDILTFWDVTENLYRLLYMVLFVFLLWCESL